MQDSHNQHVFPANPTNFVSVKFQTLPARITNNNSSRIKQIIFQSQSPNKQNTLRFSGFKNLIEHKIQPLNPIPILNKKQFILKCLNEITVENQGFQNNHKTLFRPYDQFTKYVDNLSQNKALARRGPFNIPINKQALLSRESTLETQKVKSRIEEELAQSRQNRIHRLKFKSYSLDPNINLEYNSMFKIKKEMVFHSLNNLKGYQSLKGTKTSNSINLFDRSLKNHQNNYQNLMSREILSKKEEIALKTSANRLAAVDVIEQKILEINPSRSNKLKKRFKKRPSSQFKEKNDIFP